MKAITITEIKLHPIAMPLVESLKTSFGHEIDKTGILVEITTESGVKGWGEVSTDSLPGYSPETMGTAAHILTEFLLPVIDGKTIKSPTDLPIWMASVRGHKLTKAGLEAAVWDAFARANEMRLTDLFAKQIGEKHESRGHAPVGVSIGIQESIDATLGIIEKRLGQGYGRIKLKIKPGWDLKPLVKVRERFPDISLMADANSAYTLADLPLLKEMDAFDLIMIEQPLAHDDIYEHSMLKREIRTPICLDESITSVHDLKVALLMDAIDILNLKPGRVGGFTESLAIYRICIEMNLPLWIGGMLECGVGRAANLAFASLPGVTLPCDISATDRYFTPDLADPPFALAENSMIHAPEGRGTGVEVIPERLAEAKDRWLKISPYRA